MKSDPKFKTRGIGGHPEMVVSVPEKVDIRVAIGDTVTHLTPEQAEDLGWFLVNLSVAVTARAHGDRKPMADLRREG